MTRRVAIVGVGQTRHAEFRNDRVYWENDYEAAKLALEDAALDKGQIDTVISSGWDAVDGRTISDMHTCMGIGGYLKDSAHVGEDGILALAYAHDGYSVGHVCSLDRPHTTARMVPKIALRNQGMAHDPLRFLCYALRACLGSYAQGRIPSQREVRSL